MNNTVIRKVKVLQGMAKGIADEYGLDPDDLVILTVSLEKIVGSPVSFLLSTIESSEEKGGSELSEPTYWIFKFGHIEVKIPKENAVKQWEMTKRIIDIFFDPSLGETGDKK